MSFRACSVVVLFAIGACGQPVTMPGIDAVDNIDAITTLADTTSHLDGATTDANAITAPNEQWTWIPLDDVTCGNGSSSGIAVNLSHRSNDVVIFLQGGGACWDVTTCFALHAAVHIDTNYGAPEFQSDLAAGGGVLMFDRTSTDNPFRNASYVYVPYCTGDLHAGDRVATYSALGQSRDVHHVGSRNMANILAHLGATFVTPRRIWLTGVSAGGYGAIFNWEQTQRVFSSSRVDVLSDCGDPVTPVNLWGTWQAAWNMQLPLDCTACTTNMTAVVDHASALSPTSRFAQLAYDQDATISTYYGISGAALQAEIVAFEHHADTMPTWRYFVLAGTTHTMTGAARTLAAPDGQTLHGFYTAFATDDPTWHSSHP